MHWYQSDKFTILFGKHQTLSPLRQAPVKIYVMQYVYFHGNLCDVIHYTDWEVTEINHKTNMFHCEFEPWSRACEIWFGFVLIFVCLSWLARYQFTGLIGLQCLVLICDLGQNFTNKYLNLATHFFLSMIQ